MIRTWWAAPPHGGVKLQRKEEPISTGRQYKYVQSTVYRKTTSVSWAAGSRWYEATARW